MTLSLILSQLSLAQTVTSNCTYDKRQRLSECVYSNGAMVKYTYDKLGNRTAVVVKGTINASYDLALANLKAEMAEGVKEAPIALSLSIENKNEVPVQGTYLKLYWSLDDTYQAGVDTEISSEYLTNIDVNEQRDLNLIVNLPASAVEGVGYIIAWLDATKLLEESDEENNTATLGYTVLSPPTILPEADFSADIQEVLEGQTIRFKDESTEVPVNWQWTFAGGVPQSSTQRDPIINYPQAGTYAVQLSVTNAVGENETAVEDFITVSPGPQLVASFEKTTLSETSGSINLSIANSGAGEMPWQVTVEAGAEWFTATSELSGTNVGSITFDYGLNEGIPRTARISVTESLTGQQLQLEIIQLAPEEITQLININEGWNLIAFSIDLDQVPLDSIFASLGDNLIEIIGEDEAETPATVTNGKAYWLRSSVATLLSFKGKLLRPQDVSLTLQEGWNLVTYLGEPADVNIALFGLGDKLLEVKSIDEVYKPAQPDALNTLDRLSPGTGYWIHVNETVVLNFGQD